MVGDKSSRLETHWAALAGNAWLPSHASQRSLDASTALLGVCVHALTVTWRCQVPLFHPLKEIQGLTEDMNIGYTGL